MIFMSLHISKCLIFFILIHEGSCWSFKPHCWIGKCNADSSEKTCSLFEKYSPICFLWECEKEQDNSWNTYNPYCWIKDCSGTDKDHPSSLAFKPHCWFLDCQKTEDQHSSGFSFLRYVPWTNKDEYSENNAESSKSWSLSVFNPRCWFARCLQDTEDESISSQSRTDRFLDATKNYINRQPVFNQLKLLQFYPSCWLGECCNDHYIPGHTNKLSDLLEKHVYGQHMVNDIIIAALRSHWVREPKSKKALALSFHGWVGSGKNYVPDMIAKSLFKLGSKSRYVHNFSSRVLFSLNSKTNEYKENLYQWLRSNITLCPRQLFIFDEVDVMPEQILNAIKPMLDYKDTVDGADYTQAIFLFLSNTGADLILERYEDLIEVENKTREEIELRDFRNLILEGAFNAQGGFHHSDSINLIDHYIPFLPMERAHVLECIKAEFLRNEVSPSKENLEYILETVRWGLGKSGQFSKSGCKLISSQVALIVEKYYKKDQKREL